ncbi:mechanosensitive ion channel domain-containing protein [Amorphus orientalis]|uniref:Small conductance mechanosensitive channel n=1 Tax=Amorphus orientalis TaxID=649198 RepID=A0AAE3VN87_9HYPH|nr:mechanosensitive ion channel domain-containing protein [Amorphus orientalis]MDQ0315067.1 small conductance mechanosensitive channel [Amorphus orientalis]
MFKALAALLVAFCLIAGPASAQLGIPLGGGGSGGGDTAQSEGEGSADQAQEGGSVEALIQILENDEARAELIEKLRATADQAPAEAQADQTEDAGPAQLAAEYTRSVAAKAAALVTTLSRIGTDLGNAFTDTENVDAMRFGRTVLNLLASMAVVFGSFFVLRLIAGRLIWMFANRAEGKGWVGRIIYLVPTLVIEAITVVVAWCAGYIFSLYFGRVGEMSIYQSLFLNAFAVIEAIKLAIRLLLMPNHVSLRVIPLGDTGSAYWYFWLSRVISLVGYGLLFVVPVAASEISWRFADALKVLVVLTAIVMTILIVLQNKTRVRGFLHRRMDSGKTDALGRFFAFLGNHWHHIAILYLVAFFVVWLVNPLEALPFMLRATLESLIAIVIGVVVTAFVSRTISFGLRLPDDVKERLPLLETRLNAFVPTVLKVVRVIVLIGVLLAIADAWNLVEVFAWLISEDGQGFVGKIISVLIVLAIGGGIYLAVTSWVEYRLNPSYGKMPTAREITLLSLLRNAFTIILSVIVFMLVLSEIGVNIGPLLASVGVLSLAFSFGAQKMVQDVVTGVFIQFENAMNTGDVVTAGGITGVVEKLSIRSVSLRSLDGTLHLVPFSSVDAVSNFMKGFSFHVAEVGVAYRENIPDVKQAMFDAFEKLKETEHGESIIGDLEMHGVTQFADSSIVVRARIKTPPGSQWAVGRAYNEIIKEIFDERGIEIPFPHVTLYMGEDKKGNAPPMRIVNETAKDARQAEETRQVEEKPATAEPSGEAANAGQSSTIRQDAPPDDGGDGGR